MICELDLNKVFLFLMGEVFYSFHDFIVQYLPTSCIKL